MEAIYNATNSILETSKSTSGNLVSSGQTGKFQTSNYTNYSGGQTNTNPIVSSSNYQQGGNYQYGASTGNYGGSSAY